MVLATVLPVPIAFSLEPRTCVSEIQDMPLRSALEADLTAKQLIKSFTDLCHLILYP